MHKYPSPVADPQMDEHGLPLPQVPLDLMLPDPQHSTSMVWLEFEDKEVKVAARSPPTYAQLPSPHTLSSKNC